MTIDTEDSGLILSGLPWRFDIPGGVPGEQLDESRCPAPTRTEAGSFNTCRVLDTNYYLFTLFILR
jgi:hypothetical protein